jgi:hypothetical protein
MLGVALEAKRLELLREIVPTAALIAISTNRDAVSNGANLADNYRQTGVYVGRVLNGAQPADLPVTVRSCHSVGQTADGPTSALLRCNDRLRHFANVLNEKPNQRAQHPVLQRQDRNRVSANLQIDR